MRLLALKSTGSKVFWTSLDPDVGRFIKASWKVFDIQTLVDLGTIYQGKNDMYVLQFRFYVFSNPWNLPTMKVGSIPKKLLHHVVAMKVIRIQFVLD